MDPKERVYNFISEQLTVGNIKKNDHITEQYLVDNLGISRTPVRESLLQLASDGIIEREHRKGFRLKTFKKEDLEDIYTMIGTLDGKIAALTLDSLTEDDYALMNFLVESMDAAIKNRLYTKYNELQEQFHNVYTNKCSNKLIVHEINKKKKIFLGKAYSNVDPNIIHSILFETNDEHRTILKLFKEKNELELRVFLEDTHWKKENVKFDIW